MFEGRCHDLCGVGYRVDEVGCLVLDRDDFIFFVFSIFDLTLALAFFVFLFRLGTFLFFLTTEGDLSEVDFSWISFLVLSNFVLMDKCGVALLEDEVVDEFDEC